MTSTAFLRFRSYRRINQPCPERALARVSKDGHKRDRASAILRDARKSTLRMRSVGLSSIHPIDLAGSTLIEVRAYGSAATSRSAETAAALALAQTKAAQIACASCPS